MGATDGYFPRGESILRQVHEQRAVGLLYGQRALAIGAIAPLNFVGTITHTRFPEQPFKRLAHTGKAFETIFFGSRQEADEVLSWVARMHERVEGVLPTDQGLTPAGTAYSAFDPEEMLWTIAVIADSAQHFHELLIGRLSGIERERLWAEYIHFGELFGMPRNVAPQSYAEFRSYYEERLSSPHAHLSLEARIVGSAIMFEIPVPAFDQIAMQVHNLVMLGSLPPRIRKMYGLRWSPAHAAAYGAAVTAVRAARPLAPRAARIGANTRFFDRVANTERSRIERGKPTPGVARIPSASR
jgi:uncharacterized protein (DUF2236 family)